MVKDMSSFKDIVHKHALPIKQSEEKVNMASCFDNDDVYFFTSNQIALGLEYLDTVENTLYLLGLSKQFLRLAKEYDLLVKDTSREYIEVSPNRIRERRNHSDYHGKPINHDRPWVKREIEFKYQDESEFLSRISEFSVEIDHIIECFETMADVFEDESNDFMVNWAASQHEMFWFLFDDVESEKEDV